MSMAVNIDELDKALESATAKIGVIGLGYVGIPLISALFHQNFEITGFDVNEERINQLNNGQSPIKHIPSSHIQEIVDGGKFEATTAFEKLAHMDAIIICVPTPLTKYREPDLSYVIKTTETIGQYLRAGQLVTLESTTYPGTTTQVMKPLLEKASGLTSGKDFFIAYSPEREDPGNKGFSASNTPKVVGGDGPDAMRLAKTLYSKIINQVVEVSSPATAEAVKLTENIFRAVNIALVNELKVVYSAMDIDVWEVIDAAATKPFGFMPFYPGPGLGGHCIPIDPFYLTWKAREFGIHTRFIELAGEINNRMMQYAIDSLIRAISDKTGRGLNGANILLVGLAYKKDVDDMRESPALKIWDMLETLGANISYYDPFIPNIPTTRDHANLAGKTSAEFTPEALKGYEAALIVTDHSDVDYAALVEHCPIVVDARNACARAGLQADNIIKT